LATNVFADALAPPKDLPPKATAFFYVASVDPSKDVSFVRLTKGELDKLATALRGKETSWSPPASRSIVAGLAASIGLASVFLLRSNRGTKLALLFVVALFASSTVADAWWNAAPPPQPAAPATPATAARLHSGLLVFELKDEGAIELIIGTKPEPGRGPKFGPVGPGSR
jgi:hypothetical protein